MHNYAVKLWFSNGVHVETTKICARIHADWQCANFADVNEARCQFILNNKVIAEYDKRKEI